MSFIMHILLVVMAIASFISTNGVSNGQETGDDFHRAHQQFEGLASRETNFGFVSDERARSCSQRFYPNVPSIMMQMQQKRKGCVPTSGQDQ